MIDMIVTPTVMLRIKFVPATDSRREEYEDNLYCHFDVVYSELLYVPLRTNKQNLCSCRSSFGLVINSDLYGSHIKKSVCIVVIIQE